MTYKYYSKDTYFGIDSTSGMMHIDLAPQTFYYRVNLESETSACWLKNAWIPSIGISYFTKANGYAEISEEELHGRLAMKELVD